MFQGALLWVTGKVGHVCTYPYVRSMYKDVSISGGGKEKKRKGGGGDPGGFSDRCNRKKVTGRQINSRGFFFPVLVPCICYVVLGAFCFFLG